MPLMIESLNLGQKVKFSPKGISMLPLIREGKDSVVLEKPDGMLAPYDIALYRRADGKYVLHRIVAVDRNGRYVCMGDNQIAKEFGITHDQVIAKVMGINRGRHQVNLDGCFYRSYCKLWYHGRRGIRLLRRAKQKLHRDA